MRVRSKPVVRAATAFFGGSRCVASGEETIHWHHLDEDPANTVAENLVPLRGDLNQEIEKHRVDPLRTLPRLLRPDALRVQAIATFEFAEHRQSYGAARLASFLARRASPDPGDQVFYAAGAITSLRAAPDPAYLADTLRRSILDPLKRGVSLSRLVSWVVRTEVAALARDYDDNRFATEVAGSGPPGATTGELLKQSARSAHCLASALLHADPLAAEEELQRALDRAEGSGFGFGVSNAKVTLVESAIERDRLALADERLADALAFCGGIERLMVVRPPQSLVKCSWWMATELLTLAAEIEHLKGKTARSQEIARHVLTIVNSAGIRPRAAAAARLERALAQPLAPLLATEQRRPEEYLQLKPLLLEALHYLG